MSPAYVFLLHSPMPDLTQAQLDRFEKQLGRVERKLDTLIKALGEDEGDPSEHSALDGLPAGQDRDPTESLG